MADNLQPIIVKKIKKGGGGHHGGAWKVAYADFVTAMMAFFLLLWLLNATTEEQKRGIAEYFTPLAVSTSSGSGSGGVMGGQSIITDGSMVSEFKPTGVTIPLPGAPEVAQDGEERNSSDIIDEEALEEAIAQREAEQFAEAEEELRQAIQSIPELEQLQDSLIVDQTPEGLRIQLVDQHGASMFASGSAVLVPEAQKLHELVAQVIGKLPNEVSIRGHTDGAPFRGAGGYSNWDLSADRANASRRALTGFGVPAERIANVTGKADTEHLDDDALSPRNRRISIVLLRDSVAPSDAAPERAARRNRSPSASEAPARPAPDARLSEPTRAVAPFRISE